MGPPAPDRPYSPRHRTALVLTGTGTAGAYHAGVLRALAEAGVEHRHRGGPRHRRRRRAVSRPSTAGPGSGARTGRGASGRSRRFYRWRPAAPCARLGGPAAAGPRPGAAGRCSRSASSSIPRRSSFGRLAGVGQRACRWLHRAGARRVPAGSPADLVSQGALLWPCSRSRWSGSRPGARVCRGRYRERGRFWWRVFGAPLSHRESARYWQADLWRLIAGGAKVPQPDPLELSRRYAELLADNLGQPGFRELLVVVHDLDSRHDVVLAALAGALPEDVLRPPDGRDSVRGADQRDAGPHRRRPRPRDGRPRRVPVPAGGDGPVAGHLRARELLARARRTGCATGRSASGACSTRWLRPGPSR